LRVRYIGKKELFRFPLGPIMKWLGGIPIDRQNPRGVIDQVVAEIGKDQVMLREVQLGLNDTIRGKNIPPELITVYAPQIVNQIVTERALAYYAKEMGYNVTDEDVAQVIQMMVPQLFEGGKFVGKEAYAQFLASNNTSITEFEKQARLRAGLRRMQSAILEGMVVTPEELEREYRARNEKVTIEFAKIDPVKIQSEIKVTPEEVNAHWASSKMQYKVQEKRTFRMVVIDEDKVSAAIQTNEGSLRSYYEANKDQFRTPERAKVRHILIKTMEKPKDQEEALKKKAEDLLKQVKGGADFAELAKKNSEDTVSAAKGGDLDWVARGQTVKPFEDAAFALQPKQISDIVKSEFGFHIIQTMEKETARLKPFEEVKDQLAKDQAKQQVFDRMQQIADQMRAALVKNPGAAEQMANEFKVGFAKVEKGGRGDVYPLVGQVTDIDNAVFDVKEKGGVTDIVTTSSNKLVIAVLDEVFPARQAELNEVEAEIRKTIASERANRLLNDRATALLDKVKSMGGDLRKAAASMGIEVKSAPEFGRDGNVEGLGTANYVEEAFRRDVGAVFGPVNVSGPIFICKTIGKTPPDMSKFNEQRFDMLLRLKGQKAQERRDLFEDGILHNLQQRGIVKIHQDVIKRLIDTFKNS
ncbi:MAG: peptidylprolyl isomerase, partial [Bryobacterales bacterium]|nr:peptidylprolyl isomerase [Bryobacterales bacterium]